MVTTPETADKPTVGVTIARSLDSGTRTVIAGHPEGSIRRILLYIVAGFGITITMAGVPAAGILGMVAIMLLLATDHLA